MRGYFGIGIENPKTSHNVGTLWRSAHVLGAGLIFQIGGRCKYQPSDTTKAWRHLPFFHVQEISEVPVPRDCALVGVELDPRAKPLEDFVHPARALYVLGAEDMGLSTEMRRRCNMIVQIPGRYCLNVAVAGSIVMYDRIAKRPAVRALSA